MARSQRLVLFAKENVAVVTNYLISDPSQQKSKDYISFLERELMAPEFFSYQNCKLLFTSIEIFCLQSYLMEEYRNVLSQYDLTAKGQVLINVVEHLCFLFLNDDTI